MRESFAPLQGQRVLVTGGLGFIGKNLTAYLTDRLKCSVTVLDDLSNAPLPVETSPNVRVIVGDVRDEATVAPLLREHPYIFHLACRNIFFCGDDPESDLTVNAGSTLKILELLRRDRPATCAPGRATSSACASHRLRRAPPTR